MIFAKNLYLQAGGYMNDDPKTIMAALTYLLISLEKEKDLNDLNQLKKKDRLTELQFEIISEEVFKEGPNITIKMLRIYDFTFKSLNNKNNKDAKIIIL